MASRVQVGADADLAADVVVIGFGAAGACAALEATAAGAQVLVLERFTGGGTSALSGGIIYAGGGTSVQRAAGVSDTPEQMLAYLTREVGDAVAPETLRRFVEESPAMIDWLQGHGVPFEPSLCPYKTSYPNDKYYLYYSGSEVSGYGREVAEPAQRGHRVKGRGTSGKKLTGPLAASAARHGVRVETLTTATRLITDADGAVVGVECRTLRDAPAAVRDRYVRMAKVAAKPGIYYPPLRKNLERRLEALDRRYGTTIRVHARRGVIVSAGGFIANRELVHRYGPQYRHGLELGSTGDDGSGILMAQEVGAATDRMGNISAWRFILPPSAFTGALLVDAEGRRVIDETRYGAAVGHKLVNEHDGLGWVLADDERMRLGIAQMRTQPAWFQRAQFEVMRRKAIRGATLEDAARKAGIDPAGLRATVEAHNAAIAAGAPDPVGKPAEFCEPVRSGPYWLLDVGIKPSVINPCPMLTLGGVVVDETTGAVRSTAGHDIPGLFAAGRTAVGICSDSYVSGLSLADCVFSGRRAGRSAAGVLEQASAEGN
ncbi:FAD-binding protein [Nocardia farcinica]|uniref:Fumarate reductase flavoprotein subunit n=1 Tax=Nocardia farcinica TaxID=37329 RepID=A0A449GMD7_NOCFR|nr:MULTISPECIES: FAD-binding protein [Nocardia]MBF6070253.1 FAD-binding protein [Nocardia farcinica]MBF6138921.1 FAD-binding protein [Nocardia farcinica]MBF6187264.1 FAD-binding protein [Nocardia farcinica]MBF6234363.1 FAD-binding protein [Nocardia farcinica]MBF6246631.1 FAD-binding protein [Nocardia elegans]